MAHKRYVPPPTPLNLSQFRAGPGGVTVDDFVKLTFKNDEVLYVAWRSRSGLAGVAWRLDSNLKPDSLEEGDWRVSENCDGIIGHRLKLTRTDTHWRTTVEFTTDSEIASIRPAKRPRGPQSLQLTGKMSSSYASDYH